MGLIDGLRPKWKNSDPDVRLAAAKELTDIKLLKEIVCTDRDWMVRHHIFMTLKDLNPPEAVFIELAKTASDEEIRRKAIKKMKDEAALEDIAKNDKFRFVRDAAEHRLEELRTNLWGEKEETPAAPEAAQ
jgi:hypothetical protein